VNLQAKDAQRLSAAVRRYRIAESSLAVDSTPPGAEPDPSIIERVQEYLAADQALQDIKKEMT
jgi:hypothetical protein